MFFAAPTTIVRTTWYVRPEGGGPYGNGDGTSYTNAFEGLENLTFGADPGDIPSQGHTIYVCGKHIFDMDPWSTPSGKIFFPGGRGYIRNEWRGDAPEEAGVIYGGHIPSYSSWVLDTDNTYTLAVTPSLYGDNYFDITGGGHTMIEPETSIANVKANPGTWWADGNAGNDTIYCQLADSSDPTGKVILPWWGYVPTCSGPGSYLDNVDWISLTFIADGKPHEMSNSKFLNCTLNFGDTYSFPIRGTTQITRNLEIINCDFRWFGNGVYTLSNTAGGKCWGLTVRGCLFEDIGIRPLHDNSDAHGVGIQGSEDVIIEDNIFRRNGDAIVLYAFSSQDMKNISIARNLIEENSGQFSNQIAITVTGDNGSMGDKSNITVTFNTVNDYPLAYKSQNEDFTIINDNIANDCGTGLKATRSWDPGSGSVGPDIEFKRNQILGTTVRQIEFGSGAATLNYDGDDNVFTGIDKFKWRGTDNQDFTAWKANSESGSVFDPNSTGP